MNETIIFYHSFLSDPQASGLSEGGVAGLVIGILIGSVLVVIGIVVVIWWYRERSSGNFKINDPVAAKRECIAIKLD